MAWVSIDDNLPDHPKFVGLSDAAIALWLRGTCYANRQLTNGFIPADASIKNLRRRSLTTELETPAKKPDGSDRNPLWIKVHGGWQIHDYADHQPTKDQVLQRRQSGADRLARFRAREKAKREEAEQRARESQGRDHETQNETAFHGDNERDGNGVTTSNETRDVTRSVTPVVTLTPAQPHKNKEQERTHGAAERRVPVDLLKTPEMRQALAIAHAVMDAMPDRRGEWDSEMKARMASQGLNYGFQGGPFERPIYVRALEAAEAVRAHRALQARLAPRAAGGRS